MLLGVSKTTCPEQNTCRRTFQNAPDFQLFSA